MNLGRTITFNSVILKNAQTETSKKYFFFNQTNNILESADRIKKIF